MGDWHIAYLAGGKGETLLWLHEFGANRDNGTRVAKYLTPHFQVIAPDLSGFGENSRPANAHYTVKAQVARLDQLSGANVLNSIMPKATKIIMENVGHVLMLEKPETSAHYYLDFLGKQMR